MDKLRMFYYKLRYTYWAWRSKITKDRFLDRGYGAMYLAYLIKYKAIEYGPKGEGKRERAERI